LEPSDSISFSTTSDTFNIDSANASLRSQQEPADSIRDSNLSRYFGGLSANLTSVTAAAVPFDIPGGATIPALSSLLALGGMRKARKKVSNNISNSVTEKII
jgi:hypothetical protein